MKTFLKFIPWVLFVLIILFYRQPAPVAPEDQVEDTEKAELVDETPIVETNHIQQIQVSLVAYSATKPEVVEPKAVEEPQAEGGFIVITADYRRYLGFDAYVQLMKSVGGKFFLIDATRNSLVAEVDLGTETFHPVSQQELNQLSLRMREIYKEGAVERILQKARDQFGICRYTVALLLPQTLDDRIQSSLERALKAKGINPATITQAKGVYRNRQLDIETVSHQRQGEMNVAARIPL